MDLSNESTQVSVPPVGPSVWRARDARKVAPDVLGQSILNIAKAKGAIFLANHVRPWGDLFEPILVVDEKVLPKVAKLFKNINEEQFTKQFQGKSVATLIEEMRGMLGNGKSFALTTYGMFFQFHTPKELGEYIQKNI